MPAPQEKTTPKLDKRTPLHPKLDKRTRPAPKLDKSTPARPEGRRGHPIRRSTAPRPQPEPGTNEVSGRVEGTPGG